MTYFKCLSVQSSYRWCSQYLLEPINSKYVFFFYYLQLKGTSRIDRCIQIIKLTNRKLAFAATSQHCKRTLEYHSPPNRSFEVVFSLEIFTNGPSVVLDLHQQYVLKVILIL